MTVKFTPDYTVSYRGVFRPAGKPFDIDVNDIEEMRRYGKVERPESPAEPQRRGRKKQ